MEDLRSSRKRGAAAGAVGWLGRSEPALSIAAPESRSLAYRPDIDGLRAAAVLLVILFHAHVPGFGGGFVGVDVFFVISGYLITRMLVADAEEGCFSLARFYERRIRRIFPALAVALLFACMLGWLYLLPTELRRFGASVVSTSLFGSNFLFWLEGGYFDAPASTKPLLHTWSLALEEQFYLVFPLLLPLLLRATPRRRAQALALAMAASLALAVWHVARYPVAAYYLAPMRAWELLLGAALALRLVPRWSTPGRAEAAAWTGLALVLGSAVVLTGHSAFPGANALLPCAGAALIIHSAAAGRTRLAGLLSLRPIVFVGLISYSLYLWHWIALVYLRAAHLDAPSATHVAAALALSAVAAALSWRYVETPVRRRVWPATPRGLFAAALVMTLLFAAGGWSMWKSGGAPSRMSPQARALADGALDVWPGFHDCERQLCPVGADGVPHIVLWGDSHAAALAPALEGAGVRALVAFDRACPPLFGLDAYDTRCVHFAEEVLARMRTDGVRRVVLHARWAWYVEGTRFGSEVGRPIRLGRDAGRDANARAVESALVRTVRRLREAGIEVTLVGPVPEVGHPVPSVLARAALREAKPPSLPMEAFERRQSHTLPLLRRVAAAEGIDMVPIHAALCSTAGCRLQSDGRALYFDDDHLSRRGAAEVAPVLRRSLWP